MSEKVNKLNYLDSFLQKRRYLFLFDVSVEDLMVTEAGTIMKRLATHLATKWRKPYLLTYGY